MTHFGQQAASYVRLFFPHPESTDNHRRWANHGNSAPDLLKKFQPLFELANEMSKQVSRSLFVSVVDSHDLFHREQPSSKENRTLHLKYSVFAFFAHHSLTPS